MLELLIFGTCIYMDNIFIDFALYCIQYATLIKCYYRYFYFFFTEAVMVAPLPSMITKNNGDSFVVDCNITGKPSPQISWTRNGVLLVQSTELIIQTVALNNNSNTLRSTLTIYSVTDSDKGTYTCTGSNVLPNGTVTHSSSFTLDVIGCKLSSY